MVNHALRPTVFPSFRIDSASAEWESSRMEFGLLPLIQTGRGEPRPSRCYLFCFLGGVLAVFMNRLVSQSVKAVEAHNL